MYPFIENLLGKQSSAEALFKNETWFMTQAALDINVFQSFLLKYVRMNFGMCTWKTSLQDLYSSPEIICFLKEKLF